MKFGLNSQEYNLLFSLAIAPLHKAGARVWIFGSRARGDHKPFSDIDVLFELLPGRSLPSGTRAQIEEALEESLLPYKVDLVYAPDMAESYRANVERDKVEIVG